MNADWVLLVPGAVLLLIPANALLSSFIQLRTFESFNNLDSRRRHRAWWWVPALWLDPARGFLGAYLVKSSLALSSTHWASVPKTDYSLLLGLMLLAIVSQVYTRREEQVLLAPIGFVAALLFALVTWPVALVGVIAGVTGLYAFRQFGAFFLFAALGVSFLGVVLAETSIWLIPAICACGVPVIASLVTGRSLELPTRDASGQDGRMM